MKTKIQTIFHNQFHKAPEKTYFSPGRVNIIGEHTDYNGGLVMPFCLDQGVYASVSSRTDGIFNVYSENFADKGIITFDIDHLDKDPMRDYANYISGMVLEFKPMIGSKPSGFDLAIISDLPVGGGLSSSAAVLVLIAKILCDQHALNLSRIDLAILSKKVENQYIGVNCGIMDQFIIANGKPDSAIYLDSASLAYEYVPCLLNGYTFLLVNSNVTRKLTESKYNVRQKESLELLHILQKHVSIDHVCELTPEDYHKYETYVSQNDLKKRFKHLVDENHRVKLARQMLISNDFKTLGMLLNEAHASVRDLYEVSSEVLDQLVEMALVSGSLGSRMIGGGFGGSTLNV
ncbi:MAG TPA: galactokinase, partial [Bacillota bacterium]|nr:galactokinase [Bacillota bacterium]